MKKIFTVNYILTCIAAAGLVVFLAVLKYNDPPTNSLPATHQIPPSGANPPPPASNPPSTPSGQPTQPQVNTPKEIVSGNTSKKQVIFTFDGGAGDHSGQEILDVAKKHNLTTTFFLTGKFAENYPTLTKQISGSGHEIFNHTYNHPYLTEISDEQMVQEFIQTDKFIYSLTGKSTRPYFRPPYGNRNAHVLEVAAQHGYQSVYWTTDALDWKIGITEEEVKKRIMDNLKPGALYLMHIGDDITGNILDEVFTQIKAQGYSIVSLTEGVK